MKAVFISYNQALTEAVNYIIDQCGIRGFSRWEETYGRGSREGEPHFGSHTWPSKNTSVLAVIDDHKVAPLLEKLRALDDKTRMQGLRAFVWNIEDQI